jgi:hypothetical protein
VVLWQTRKRKDAQLSSALHAHIETMWSIASTLTGDDAPADSDDSTAVEVVREVTRRVLPQGRRSLHRGLKLEIVVATTEAAATRVFSPGIRRIRGGAHAAPLNPQAAALRRAFSRRLSWDVQALLWATEVEDIAEPDVERLLGQIDPQAGRLTVRLAYLDLRRDLNDRCRATLRSICCSSDPETALAADNHLRSCALCQAEARWLSDLGSALRSLPSPLPDAVWEGARRVAAGEDGARAFASVGHDGSNTMTAPPPEASPERADVEVSLVATTQDDSAIDDTAQDEGAGDDIAQDEGAQDQGARDDSAQGESAIDGTTQDDIAQDEGAQGESAQDETAIDDAAQDDTAQDTAENAGTATNGHDRGLSCYVLEAQKDRDRVLHR